MNLNSIKTKISILMLVLTLTLLLVACGETTATTPVAGSNGAQTTAPAKTSGGTSGATTGAASSEGDASSACGFFTQEEAEAVMGAKLKKYKGQDSAVFRTCYYSTFDGSLESKDSSMLSLSVFTVEATPQWYSEVKKGYQEISPTQTLTPVEGIGNEAFSFVGTLMGNKTFTLGVLKNKTFFSIKIDNTKLDEAAQTAKLKDLALEIAAGL